MNLPDNKPIKVEHYRSGRNPVIRQNAHVNFVTSQTTVVVATVSFGMDVDKIDTRRISQQTMQTLHHKEKHIKIDIKTSIGNTNKEKGVMQIGVMKEHKNHMK